MRVMEIFAVDSFFKDIKFYSRVVEEGLPLVAIFALLEVSEVGRLGLKVRSI